MMLQKLAATNVQGSTLELPLEDISAGYYIQGIDGLGPVKATMATSRFAALDGEHYHSAHREPRNIVIKLGLDPDFAGDSAYDLRAQLYSFFMPKTEVELEFTLYDKFGAPATTVTRQIRGRIETNEPDIFSKDPAVVISILCFQPDFIDPIERVVNGTTSDTTTTQTVTYDGTVETGFYFTLYADQAISEVRIYQTLPEGITEEMRFQGLDLADTDQFEVDTVPGQKIVGKRPSGWSQPQSRLYTLTIASSWLKLHRGDNLIRVYSPITGVPWDIRYTDKHGGL